MPEADPDPGRSRWSVSPGLPPHPSRFEGRLTLGESLPPSDLSLPKGVHREHAHLDLDSASTTASTLQLGNHEDVPFIAHYLIERYLELLPGRPYAVHPLRKRLRASVRPYKARERAGRAPLHIRRRKVHGHGCVAPVEGLVAAPEVRERLLRHRCSYVKAGSEIWPGISTIFLSFSRGSLSTLWRCRAIARRSLNTTLARWRFRQRSASRRPLPSARLRSR